MNETIGGNRPPGDNPLLCFDKWHGIFYMPSRIDEAGHTKALDYPVAEHWGESRNVQARGWDSNRQHISPESSALPTTIKVFRKMFRYINTCFDKDLCSLESL